MSALFGPDSFAAFFSTRAVSGIVERLPHLEAQQGTR